MRQGDFRIPGYGQLEFKYRRDGLSGWDIAHAKDDFSFIHDLQNSCLHESSLPAHGSNCSHELPGSSLPHHTTQLGLPESFLCSKPKFDILIGYRIGNSTQLHRSKIVGGWIDGAVESMGSFPGLANNASKNTRVHQLCYRFTKCLHDGFRSENTISALLHIPTRFMISHSRHVLESPCHGGLQSSVVLSAQHLPPARICPSIPPTFQQSLVVTLRPTSLQKLNPELTQTACYILTTAFEARLWRARS
jgi:hypothetical protein